jgi:cobalt-zinc-cadmium efflux system outer membrane protein
MRTMRGLVGSLIAAWLSAATSGCMASSTQRSLRSVEDALDPPLRAASASTREPIEPVVARSRAALDLGATLDLETVERLALEGRPALLAAAHKARALTARAAAEGTLPAPELMLDLWQIPFAKPYALDKAGMIMMSVKQEIPAAGTLDLAAQGMALEARAAAAMATVESRMLLREVDRTFADYVEATLLHAAHEEHRRIVAQMAGAARARYSTGAPLADITKADLELTKMAADLTREHGRIEEARARLRGLIAQPESVVLGPPRLDEPVSVGLAVDPILARALEKSPEVMAARLMEQAAQTSVKAADLEAKVPSFLVGVSAFLPMNDMPAGYGTSFAMSLPWVWGAGGRKVESAKHRVSAERATAAEARLRVRAAVSAAHSSVRAAEHLFVVLRDHVKPAAQRSLEAAQAGYAAGGSDLLAWLDAERSSLDVDAELAGARGNLARALADLDWAAGEHVPRAPLSAEREPNHEH